MEQTRNSDASIVALGWFAFRWEYRNPSCGGSLMKPVGIGSSIGLDRLATWNEVMCATSDEGTFALVRDSDDLREADSDFSVSPCNLAEDDLWLAIVCEMPDSKSN
jgi:hypothetical protein